MKFPMKKIIFLSFFALLAVGCNKTEPIISKSVAPSPTPAYNYVHQMQIGNQILNVEIANTPATEQQGLSDRVSMDSNQGMLFDFGPSASIDPPFWMKDMNFNLDFIWIFQNKIIGITPNAPAQVKGTSDTTLPLYYPPSPINQILEVNAGWAEKNNVKTGDQTKILN